MRHIDLGRNRACMAALWVWFALTGCKLVQAQEVAYSHRVAWSGFTEYSNDSSHMLMGYADGRSIAAAGISVERRTFLGAHFAGSALGEFIPVMVMSDPTMKGMTFNFPAQPSYSGTVRFTSQVPVVTPVSSTPLNVLLITSSGTYTGTASYIAGRRWTYMSSFSPIGYKLSMLPSRRLQPFVTGLTGFAVASRDLPVLESSAFNFVLQAGVGVEWFRNHNRSYRLEYRYHHLSNRDIGAVNPGVDSGVFKVSYTFGR